MSMFRTSAYRSPCEVLRCINDICQGDSEKDVKIRELLAEAEELSKRMSIELHKHRPEFYKIWRRNKTANQDDARRSNKNYKYHKK